MDTSREPLWDSGAESTSLNREGVSIEFGRTNQIRSWRASKLQPWAPIPIRLIVGYGFIAHGYDKLIMGPEHFADILHVLGVPMPHLMGWVVIVSELLGGVALFAGAFVKLVSIPMAAILLVSMFTLELPNGFLSIKLQGVTSTGVQLGKPGYEPILLYLACLATLVIGGAGPYSVDCFSARRKTRDISKRTQLHGRMTKQFKPDDDGQPKAKSIELPNE